METTSATTQSHTCTQTPPTTIEKHVCDKYVSTKQQHTRLAICTQHLCEGYTLQCFHYVCCIHVCCVYGNAHVRMKTSTLCTFSPPPPPLSLSLSLFPSAYDCGVYALMFAERVCRIKMLKEPVSLLSSITSASVTQQRTDTLTLINSLA